MPLTTREVRQLQAAVNGMAAVSQTRVERRDWKGSQTENVQAVAAPDVISLIEAFGEETTPHDAPSCDESASQGSTAAAADDSPAGG